MPLTQFLHFLRDKPFPSLPFTSSSSSSASPSQYTAKLRLRVLEVLTRTWDLGFTAFGGPPVHFQILHRRFVETPSSLSSSTSTADPSTSTSTSTESESPPWLTEQTYQELFALAQALPGPGSTKMLFSIVLLHSGFLPALLAFLVWSLPGAAGMYGLSLGVRSIADTLPATVYAFLSGLNAATVGIVAVAAVQLAEKCVRDKLTRVLVLFGGAAGLCYSALWYFPVLVAVGGVVAVVWDAGVGRGVRRLRARLVRRGRRGRNVPDEDAGRAVELQSMDAAAGAAGAAGARKEEEVGVSRRANAAPSTQNPKTQTPKTTENDISPAVATDTNQTPPTDMGVSIPISIAVLVTFSLFFIAVLVARGRLPSPPLPFDLFANMLLAGTIIFGGGPVVIPLLREYVVTPGWVSPRDFLIGLAIIQAFPGPNFNFGVYLGALTVAARSSLSASTSTSAAAGASAGATSNSGGVNAASAFLGAALGFLGIFLPGLSFAVGVQGIWRRIRTQRFVLSALRGINATAVGLVFTAVYRLWEVGYLTAEVSGARNLSSAAGAAIEAGRGRSLADEPWWVVVASVTYCGNKFFGVPAAVGIAIGGLLGLVWHGVTQT